jgi:hypothetical protein
VAWGLIGFVRTTVRIPSPRLIPKVVPAGENHELYNPYKSRL